MDKRNTTVKTIEKVEDLFNQLDKPMSVNYISKEIKVHYYKVMGAIDFLLKHNFLKKITNSTNIDLYIKNEN